MKRRSVPEYDGFDRYSHQYIIATAGGDGWEITESITPSVQADILQAADDADTDEKAQAIKDIDWREWIDSLAVYDGDFLVAEFDLQAWQWD